MPAVRPGGLETPHPSRLDPGRADYHVILAAHAAANAAGAGGYTDPSTGLFVLTARSLLDRGTCCDQGCRHCPYVGAPPGGDVAG